MGKLLFRVESSENSELKQEDTIAATGRYRVYLQELDDSNPHFYKNIIENTLTKVQGVDRRDYLFLFDELKDALIFSSKIHKGNARIYLVDVNAADIQYKGDMNALDCLSVAINLGINDDHPDYFDSLCRNYWKCGKTFSPCYEYLVRHATMKEVICNQDDCLKFHSEYSERSNYAFLSIERTNIYLEKLNKLASILK